jgi:hypothetical protein
MIISSFYRTTSEYVELFSGCSVVETAPANSQDSAERKRRKRRLNKTNPINHDASNRAMAIRQSIGKDCSITNHNRCMVHTAKSPKLDCEPSRGSYLVEILKYLSSFSCTTCRKLAKLNELLCYLEGCNNHFIRTEKSALQGPYDRKSETWLTSLLECMQMEQRIETRIGTRMQMEQRIETRIGTRMEATKMGCKQLHTANHTLINLWSGREHTHPRSNLSNQWENTQVVEDMLTDVRIPPFDDRQLFNTKGHRLLGKWKRTSGRSKTWKRCPRSKQPQQSPCLKTTSPANFGGCQFFVSPLWIPSTLLRIEQKVRPQRVKRLTRSPKARQRCKWRDTQIMDGRNQIKDSWVIYSFPQKEYSPEKSSDQWAAAQIHTKPSAVFIRFTWKDMILAKGSGDLDRFLPTGLVLHSCWRVEHFLRNDPHADVYRASNIQQSSRLSLEAHIFLDEYHSNCKTFAKRHKHRLEQSGNCAAKLWYQGRHVLVMTVPGHFERFKLKNNEKEYPSLNNQGKGSRKAVLSRSFQGKPTYAAILRKGIAERRTANRSQDMRLGKVNETALDTWLDPELVVREKKAKKQRDKRQTKRSMKRAEKDIKGLAYIPPDL